MISSSLSTTKKKEKKEILAYRYPKVYALKRKLLMKKRTRGDLGYMKWNGMSWLYWHRLNLLATKDSVPFSFAMRLRKHVTLFNFSFFSNKIQIIYNYTIIDIYIYFFFAKNVNNIINEKKVCTESRPKESNTLAKSGKTKWSIWETNEGLLS